MNDMSNHLSSSKKKGGAEEYFLGSETWLFHKSPKSGITLDSYWQTSIHSKVQGQISVHKYFSY